QIDLIQYEIKMILFNMRSK
ncbi:unnamed protein product, partial [Rotaria magnacalcarata]